MLLLQGCIIQLDLMNLLLDNNNGGGGSSGGRDPCGANMLGSGGVLGVGSNRASLSLLVGKDGSVKPIPKEDTISEGRHTLAFLVSFLDSFVQSFVLVVC